MISSLSTLLPIRESNLKMNESTYNTLSLSCPSCGGKMELSADGKKAECPYCGHTMLIEKDDRARKAYEM